MTVKKLFMIDAIVCLLFGIPFIFSTQKLAAMFVINPALSEGAIAILRSYGFILLSAGVALWMSRNSIPSAARRGFIIFICLSGILITINTIHAIITGPENSMAWGIVILAAIIALWAGMLLPKEKINGA
jgi:hypothetical protein